MRAFTWIGLLFVLLSLIRIAIYLVWRLISGGPFGMQDVVILIFGLVMLYIFLGVALPLLKKMKAKKAE